MPALVPTLYTLRGVTLPKKGRHRAVTLTLYAWRVHHDEWWAVGSSGECVDHRHGRAGYCPRDTGWGERPLRVVARVGRVRRWPRWAGARAGPKWRQDPVFPATAGWDVFGFGGRHGPGCSRRHPGGPRSSPHEYCRRTRD